MLIQKLRIIRRDASYFIYFIIHQTAIIHMPKNNFNSFGGNYFSHDARQSSSLFPSGWATNNMWNNMGSSQFPSSTTGQISNIQRFPNVMSCVSDGCLHQGQCGININIRQITYSHDNSRNSRTVFNEGGSYDNRRESDTKF